MKKVSGKFLETDLHLSTNYKIDDLLCKITFIQKGDISYGNVASVFDIEASSFYENDEKRSIMYAWVFGLNGKCMFGRTWEDFSVVINKLVTYYNLNTLNKRLIIYVHNLAYEFQFFKNYFNWDNVFCLDERKPIYAVTDCGIEFRCSYILSNLSLERVGKNLTKYKVQKKVGDLDYNLLRHTKTPLTNEEWGYVLNDGLVVMAYIQEEIERLGDITKLPITSTGYVRNYCREACFKSSTDRFQYSKMMKHLTLSVDDYHSFKLAFAGGFTHANANYVGLTVENVSSYDFTSSYPAVMLSEKFPMSKPKLVEIENEKDLIFYLKNYCCIFDITFKNIWSTVDYENYISYSKCTECEHYVVNNGRVKEASKLSLTITELDFLVINKMYSWEEMTINNFRVMRKGYLPKPIIECILDFYKKKTTLKGVEGEEAEYQASKAMINSIFGMCVTDPCRPLITFAKETGWSKEYIDERQLLDEYNENSNRFLYYAWGVWITAYARYNLFTGINEFGNDYIYSDTDSVKVLNANKHKKYFDRYNKQVTKKVESCLRYYNLPIDSYRPKTINGVEKPIGVWDYEGTYSKFKTMGAKRYMYVDNGELHITIAGVSKSKGVEYLLNTNNSFDEIFEKFDEGLTFPASYIHNGEVLSGSGKLCHTYIDCRTKGKVKDYRGEYALYDEWSSVHLEGIPYEMSIASEFLAFIIGIRDL